MTERSWIRDAGSVPPRSWAIPGRPHMAGLRILLGNGMAALPAAIRLMDSRRRVWRLLWPHGPLWRGVWVWGDVVGPAQACEVQDLQTCGLQGTQ